MNGVKTQADIEKKGKNSYVCPKNTGRGRNQND